MRVISFMSELDESEVRMVELVGEDGEENEGGFRGRSDKWFKRMEWVIVRLLVEIVVLRE